MRRWRTTEHENGFQQEEAGSVSVVQALVVSDCLKVVLKLATTQIPLNRLTRVGKGTTFCRTRKRARIRSPTRNQTPAANFLELFARSCCQLTRPLDVVAKSDVHEHAAAGGFETNYQGFGVFTAGGAVFGSVQNGGMYAEMETLVIQGGDGVSGDLIGQLANRFPDQVVGLGQFGSGKATGDSHGCFGVEIEDNSAFDVSGERDDGGHALAPVGLLLHAEVPNRHWGLQALCQDGIRRVDERLDQLHLHR